LHPPWLQHSTWIVKKERAVGWRSGGSEAEAYIPLKAFLELWGEFGVPPYFYLFVVVADRAAVASPLRA